LSLRLAQGKYKGEIKGDPSSGPLAGFVWKQLFPEAYSPIVEFVSKVGGVDRFLIWSIMKNESTFRPGVKSPVGAVGLMQLMPTTAEKMMMKISGKGVDRRRLGEPSVNITLGAAYLAKLFSLMPGNAVGVIASYNAGEEAVLRWLANGHLNDIEEWIEEIPYGETNLYVKKVLATYWNYCKLYGS
jgi:soluble lytic murein transglycosylase